MKILVTGGAGYIGSVCAQELLDQNHEVTVLDDLSTGHRTSIPSGAEFRKCRIGEAGMFSFLNSKNFDAVFHFAAMALVGESIIHPSYYYETNVIDTIRFFDAVRLARIPRIVFSSSAAVYGSPTGFPIKENDLALPVNPYGETKLAIERLLSWYARAYNLHVTIFRYFNAAGATALHGENHRYETHVIPLLLEVAAGEREYFTIHGQDYSTPDGTCMRDYVHVLDIARAHILALTKPSGIYNIGIGNAISVRDLVNSVERVTGRKIPCRVGLRRDGDPPFLCADPSRLIKDFEWQPRYSDIDAIVQTAWEWKMRGTQ